MDKIANFSQLVRTYPVMLYVLKGVLYKRDFIHIAAHMDW